MNHPSLRVLREEHVAVAAVLRSLQLMLDKGPQEEAERFFDVMRAMLFYIDEFPERLHHPSESNLLFPKLLRVRPDLMPVIQKLESEHVQGEGRVRELQHLLLAWELLGDSRRPVFTEALDAYVRFYLGHMRLEEEQVLPAAMESLPPQDWQELDAAIHAHRDPIASGKNDPGYDRLFTRIVLTAPAPVGVGRPLEKVTA